MATANVVNPPNRPPRSPADACSAGSGADVHSATASSPADDAVAESLGVWRHRATGIFLSVFALAYLPAVLLLVFGDYVMLSLPMEALTVGFYMVSVAAALVPRVDYRIRVWLLLFVGYTFAVAGSVAVPDGPIPRGVPSSLPIVALVLVGPRSARFATIVSVLVLVFAPFLCRIPLLWEFLARGAAEPPSVPAGTLLTQGAGLAGRLVGVMVLLDCFHQFLMRALAEQGAASERACREARDREAANRLLGDEIAERCRLEREIAGIAEEERQRLGQDVHDGVCQQLTGAMLRCRALEARRLKGQPLASDDLAALASLLEETVDEAHAVAQGLCPLDTHPQALADAVQGLVARTQATTSAECRLIVRGDVAVVGPDRALHLFRIVQEALSNAVRHAQATSMEVELSGIEDQVELRVEDNGRGLPARLDGRGMGLRTMESRARLVGGELAIHACEAGGTRVVCRIPRHGSGSETPFRIRRGDS